MAPAAKNLVVLGDQMQLSQPMQGVHPGESGTSILDYYFQDHATIPDEQGIFLPTTYRMRPEICGFISNAFYEGRLKHEECTLDRSIRFEHHPKLLQRSAGITFIPVEHTGNTYESEEEVLVVREIIEDLLGQPFEENGKVTRPISEADILVVAPFNLQVRRLKAALARIRVGTVDKFQGQQAPVVIFSMTASEGDASPRGIEFLFDRNRLNVAISRAQVLAIIAASPKLEITRCSRLEQMQLVNLFCRAAQAGTSGRAFETE
jgi:superfamily I DNA and/or RNA helicase